MYGFFLELFYVNCTIDFFYQTKLVFKWFYTTRSQNDKMSKSIEKIAVFFLLLYGAIGFIPATLLAQIYVSSPSCVQNPLSTNSGCDQPTIFFDRDTTSQSRTWTFSDGTYLNAAPRKFSYTFPSAGSYTVTLTKVNAAGVTTTETENITVGTFPLDPKFNKKAKTDTTVCDSDSLKLNPYAHLLGIPPSNVRYKWFPNGETTPTIYVDSSGCYSVEVINTLTGCSRTASINVKFCLQSAPSADAKEKWYFGQKAAIDFQLTGTWENNRDTLDTENSLFSRDSTLTDPAYLPSATNTGSKVNTNEATAMVYGPDAALKLYTDGLKIYNFEDQPLKDTLGNAVNLNLAATSQGLAIIPKNSCNECPHHQYYVFGVDKATQTLTYSIVDMRYNNRRGAVIETNIPLLYPVTERFTAMFNIDSTGYLLFAHQANSNTFTILSMDSTGIAETSVSLGIIQDTPESQYGYSVISPNGRTMAIGVVKGGKNYIELYDIDRENLTLVLNKTIELEAAPPKIYGLAFSLNSDMLYVTLKGDGATIPSKLYQLALSNGDGVTIATNKILIDQSNTEKFGALQLGPINGNGAKYIYMAIEGATNVPYLQNIELSGGASVLGYTRIPGSAVQGVPLLPGRSGLGFPTVIYAKQVQEGDGIQATYKGNCFKSATVLETQAVCSPMRNEVEWEFENGTKLKGASVSYVFPKTGWNEIRLKITTFNPSNLPDFIKNTQVGSFADRALQTPCKEKIIIDSIYIKPSPTFTLPDSAYICTRDIPAKLITLTPNPTGGDTFEYNWQTGTGVTIAGTTPLTSSLPIAGGGNYILNIKNNFDCESEKKFKIVDKCEPRMFTPNSFSPNNDAVNDKFDVYSAHIKNFELKVYDRWGKIVFTSNDPDEKWDGSINGKVFAPMIYPFIIKYESMDFPERGVLQEKGSITVLK